MLRPGDKVKMNGHRKVRKEEQNKIWTVSNFPWELGGVLLVSLMGRRGPYPVDGLDLVERGKNNE